MDNDKHLSDKELSIFNAIVVFISELSAIYKKKHHPLKLYEHLLKHTTFTHVKSVKKHIEIFSNFCKTNSDAIQNKDDTKLIQTIIKHNDKIYVDMSYIFKIAKKDTDIIWTHLLLISYKCDPDSVTKEILLDMKSKKNESDSGVGSGSLSTIMSKIEKHIDIKNTKDPMSAVGSIIQSGAFNDIVSEIQTDMSNGKIDLNELVNNIQTIVPEITQNIDPSLITTLLGSIQTPPSPHDHISAPPSIEDILD